MIFKSLIINYYFCVCNFVRDVKEYLLRSRLMGRLSFRFFPTARFQFSARVSSGPRKINRRGRFSGNTWSRQFAIDVKNVTWRSDAGKDLKKKKELERKREGFFPTIENVDITCASSFHETSLINHPFRLVELPDTFVQPCLSSAYTQTCKLTPARISSLTSGWPLCATTLPPPPPSHCSNGVLLSKWKSLVAATS